MQLAVLLKVLLTRNRACRLQQGPELQERLNGGPHNKQFLSPTIQIAPPRMSHAEQQAGERESAASCSQRRNSPSIKEGREQTEVVGEWR